MLRRRARGEWQKNSRRLYWHEFISEVSDYWLETEDKIFPIIIEKYRDDFRFVDHRSPLGEKVPDAIFSDLWEAREEFCKRMDEDEWGLKAEFPCGQFCINSPLSSDRAGLKEGEIFISEMEGFYCVYESIEGEASPLDGQEYVTISDAFKSAVDEILQKRGNKGRLSVSDIFQSSQANGFNSEAAILEDYIRLRMDEEAHMPPFI